MIKKVFVNNDNVIEVVTNDVEYINGEPQFVIDGRKVFYAGNILKKLNADSYHDEVEVEDTIVPFKYCYTKEQGVYENPNWPDSDVYKAAVQDYRDKLAQEVSGNA